MDSSGIIGNFENEDLENEIYEDDEFLQRNIIEENCDSSVNYEESIYSSDAPPPPPAHASTTSFQSQVDAFINATAALRRQLSSSSNNSGNGSTTANLLDALRAADFDTQSNGNEPKLSWRQILLGESGTRSNIDSKDVRSNSGVRNYRKNARVWDDDFVLRRQFAALIPAFDPRPGRTNVNQVFLIFNIN